MNYESKETPVTFDNGSQGKIVLQYPIKEKSKLYIIGCASTKNEVPWDDQDAEYWGVNNLYGVQLPGMHYDRWFEIHNIWQDPKNGKFLRRNQTTFREQPIIDYLNGLAKLECAVYMQKHWQNLIPYSIQYPLDDIVNFFTEKGFTIDICRYLTNTIAYEIVLGIYLGFDEIQVWGVDMAIGTEYEHQKACCEFWLGVALGMGIKVYMPPKADLLKTRFLYGIEEKQSDIWNEKVEKARVEMKLKRLNLEAQQAEISKSIEQYRGGEATIQDLKKIWANLADDLLYQKRGS